MKVNELIKRDTSSKKMKAALLRLARETSYLISMSRKPMNFGE